MMEAIQFDIAKLELEDGDILLVSVPTTWTSDQMSCVHMGIEMALERAGKRVTVLSGSNEVKFTIVRRAHNAQLEGDDVG